MAEQLHLWQEQRIVTPTLEQRLDEIKALLVRILELLERDRR